MKKIFYVDLDYRELSGLFDTYILSTATSSIDDRTARGVDAFAGVHIHFGTPDFPTWPTVVAHLAKLA